MANFQHNSDPNSKTESEDQVKMSSFSQNILVPLGVWLKFFLIKTEAQVRTLSHTQFALKLPLRQASL